MNCISMLLMTSDVMAVRRAVFAAGASRVVFSSLPNHTWSAHFQVWCFGKDNTRCDAPIRIEVGVDEDHADEVVSAFLTTAHVGTIERIAKHPAKSTKGIFQRLLHAA